MTIKRPLMQFFKKKTVETSTPQEMRTTAVEKHDRYNFEAKLDYHLEKDLKSNRYELEMFFFIPNSLQINPSTYSEQAFFADMHNYMRFKTLPIGFIGLMNPENPHSPFNIISQRLLLIQNGENTKTHFDRIIYELRVLGCIIKSTLRDEMEFIAEMIHDDAPLKEIMDKGEKLLEQTHQVQLKIHTLENDLNIPQLRPDIHDTFSFVDKYISRQISEYSANLYTSLELNGKIGRESKKKDQKEVQNEVGSEKWKIIRAKLTQILQYESDNPSPLASKFEINPEKSNETFSYWDGILKKYVQNVLYLDLQPSRQKSKALEVFYSLAAGAAMFFSIILGFLLIDQVSEYSYGYFALLIVVYMLKDRFKDWIRLASNKFVQKYFPDRKFYIFDSAHQNKIGNCKESIRFLQHSQIPQDIINFRERSAKTPIEHEGKPETVFKYVKSVTLHTNKIMESHERHGDVNDIIRFNVKHFLQYADDPISKEIIWDSTNTQILTVNCAKVYHINAIMKLKTISEERGTISMYYKKIRVILDQNGILRVTEHAIVR
ncbi:MAG: hypothetical protein ACTSRK_17195 [Promethearchaeota archaeon]